VIHEEPTSIGDIEFRDVTFAYPTNPSKKILKNLTLIPLKNKFNAIVGTTGSGKSTFTQLLMKTYPPNEGKVLIGGRNIEDVGTGWLREKIGYVGQEPTLFNGTLRENILVGKENATDD
jgi:ABC-type multidrug transport system fused ATPase/permease subunit